MKPVLDPKRDLAGATPETLARALFRPDKPKDHKPDGVREQSAKYASRRKRKPNPDEK